MCDCEFGAVGISTRVRLPIEARRGSGLSLEPDLQVIMRLLMWVLRTELKSSVRAQCALNW